MSGGKEEIERKVIAYLGQKYSEKFNIINSYVAGIDVQYDEIKCCSERYPEDEFSVYIEYLNGEIIYSDGYFGVLKKEEFANKLDNVIGRYIDEYKMAFVYNVSRFDSKYIEDVALEDVMRNDYFAFVSSVSVFVDTSKHSREKMNSVIDVISERLKKENFNCSITIFWSGF